MFLFIYFAFYYAVAPSINRAESSSDFSILMTSSISSIQMNKMNPFPALAAPLLLISLSNLSNTDKVALVANSGKTALAKETAKSIGAFALISYRTT